MWNVIQGDCIEVMRGMASDSVDSIVTDPPYGLSFMGKKWDYDVPSVEAWAECLRVLKPGGHLLSFAGTRTHHRMAVNIEDAGFEIRDMIAWVYGSGFPKSHDVSKAIDKAAGVDRKIVGIRKGAGMSTRILAGAGTFRDDRWKPKGADLDLTAPATEAAKRWQGWGTALKPALEPITVARKPFKGTVAQNVLKHGTGGINVDGCRIPISDRPQYSARPRGKLGYSGGHVPSLSEQGVETLEGSCRHRASGRWPANLIHDGSEEALAGFPETASGKPCGKRHAESGYNGGWGLGGDVTGFGGTGSASRVFYCAKASKDDRDEGCGGMEAKFSPTMGCGIGVKEHDPVTATRKHNTHPTVKPTDLMRYLCRLVTPPGGTVLDPFCGSGSTGKGALREGFSFIGIEMDAEYVAIAKARLAHLTEGRLL